MPDGKAGSPVRLVLADDHEDVLRELRALLHPEFEVVASVTDGFALIDAARQWKPDVVISDIEMPGLTNGRMSCRPLSALQRSSPFLTDCTWSGSSIRRHPWMKLWISPSSNSHRS